MAVGHPVDVASGNLFHLFDDYTLPGRFPISFKRRYSTGLLDRERAGLFGRGWSSPFDVRLYTDERGLVYLNESGESEYAFPVPESGIVADQPVLNAGSFAELTATESEYCVTRWDPDNGWITRDFFSRSSTDTSMSIVRREDAESNAIEFSYSRSSGLLKYIYQKRERRGFQLAYDDFNRLVQVRRRSKQTEGESDREDRQPWLQYSYNPAGMLETFTDPLGNQSHYKYDASGQMTSEVTLAGKEWRFVFDQQGRCVITTGKNKFDYHKLDYGKEAGRVTKVEDSYGNVTQYHYNEAGQVLKTVSPLGHTSSTIFDAAGRIVQSISPEGRTTTYEYDDAGNRSSVMTADGARVSYEFNERHQAISMMDPELHVWRRTYDMRGRVVSQTNPAGATQYYHYDANGDLTVHEDALKSTRTFNWDIQGNLAKASDWEGNSSTYEWDPYGSLSRYSDPLERVTFFKRDRIGQLLEVALPDGNTRHYQWDVFGNLTSYTDERHLTTRWQYCDCGNLEYELCADGSAITYHWNSIPGQLAAITNQKNEVYHFIYDADGRLVEESSFAGAITRHDYNSDNLVTRTSRPSGKYILYEYNGNGKVSRVGYSSGEETSYDYDSRGLLRKADNGECPVSFEYDMLGRLTHETQGSHELWHEYDALDHRIARHSSLVDTTRFEWTPNGLIDQVQPAGNTAVRFQYDAGGFETCRHLGSLGLQSRFDRRGRLFRQELDAGKGRKIVQRQYDYDVASNLVVKTDSQWGKIHYAYDQLEHVTHALYPDGISELFQYDRAENVSSYARTDLRESEYDVDEEWFYEKGSRISRKSGVSYRYDEDGQLIERRTPQGECTFQWNDARQLVLFTNESGETWRYRYDALSRRVAKEGPQERQVFCWDGDVVLHHCRTEGNADEHSDYWEFHPHDFSPLYKISESRQHLCVNDHIGTPAELVDPEGEVTWSRQSWTFGSDRVKRASSTDCNIRFQGQWYDAESGLCYNRYRYYSAEISAFISDDPIKLAGGLNARFYAVNPIVWTDVLGLTGTCPGVAKGPLDWGGSDPQGRSRKDHVRLHGVDDPNRNVPHGVFTGNPINQTADAFARGKAMGIVPQVQGNRLIYDIPSPNAGYQGGNPNHADHGRTANTIRIVTDRDSNRLITAFPTV